MTTSAGLRLIVLAVAGAAAGARAGEPEILKAIQAFFETDGADRREELVRQIQNDPAYAREQVTEWLHQAVPFEPRTAGMQTIDVALRDGQSRSVVLRIPARYDPARPWPLIYALHGTHGSGDDIVRYVEHVLGSNVEQYVVAAPSGYGEVVVHDVWPPAMEHPTIWAAVKRAVHVDSDRVFVLGYSRGGHAAWTLAVLHADQFAGVVALAGTFVLPEVDKLWDTLLPNLADSYVLCAWGAGDTGGDDRAGSPQGGIAGLNRTLCALADSLHLPVRGHEDPDKGHGNVEPPPELLKELLSRRRTHYPAQVRHRFRDIYQAQAYWLEGHAWTGPQWTEKLPSTSLRQGEDPHNREHVREAVARTIRGTLGELRGTIDARSVDVRRNKVSELTIWFGDGMIDWSQPVTVKVSGRTVYEGKVAANLFVCLSQAARSYDFDRLRWAGLRFKSGARIRAVTGQP